MAKSKSNTKSEQKKPIQAESKRNEPILIKVKCLNSFWDLTIDRVREVGEEWSIEQERLDAIQTVERTVKQHLVKVL